MTKLIMAAAFVGLAAAASAYADGLAQASSVTQERTSAGGSLSAKLVDAEARARKGEAVVQVEVRGVKLSEGQNRLMYKVDNGPAFGTTATKVSFHDLEKGQHAISVMLSGKDDNPLGPSETINVLIP